MRVVLTLDYEMENVSQAIFEGFFKENCVRKKTTINCYLHFGNGGWLTLTNREFMDICEFILNILTSIEMSSNKMDLL